MNFPYMYAEQSLDSINIENIGNVCLEAHNDLGKTWFFSIRTILGWSLIESWGPITSDNYMDYHYRYTSDYEEYSDSRIPKKIDKFINDSSKMITQIFFTDRNEVLNKVKTLNCLQKEEL